MAYIAGIIDGDGSILIVKERNPKYGIYLRPYLEIGEMIEKKPLEKIFHWLVEAGFRPCKRIKKKASSNVFSLAIRQTDEIKNLLKEVLPYLIAKKKHAALLIEFCELKKTTHPRKLEIYYELKNLIPKSMQRRKIDPEIEDELRKKYGVRE